MKQDRREKWARALFGHEPSMEVFERAARVPEVVPAPPVARSYEILIRPRDVRGTGAGVAGDARIVAQSTDDAQVSIMVLPPSGDRQWQLEGRVWLKQPSDQPIGVVLCHDDHVLQQCTLPDGGRFRMSETMAAGWSLEFHLPSGNVLVMKDPLE